MKIHAIRSLQCVDHAVNIPPNVLSIEWMLGKRCNYDCSYCSPHTHDSVSPFINSEKYSEFIKISDHWAISQKKKIKWSFTGGEPFIDRGFFKLLELLSVSDSTEQTNVVTNGSLPLSLYLDHAHLLTGITFSIHLERSLQETTNTIEKIIKISQQTKTFVSVNLMFLPGKMEQVIEIKSLLESASIPYVVRRITPPRKFRPFLPFVVNGAGRKSVTLLDLDSQSKAKNQWKNANDIGRESETERYYTDEEDLYLNECNNNRKLWQNLGAWSAEGYFELNSDQLIASKTNKFPGWTCFAGVDHITIDFDGTIYRAKCFNDGPIGKIGDSVVFSDTPTICKKQWCKCSSSIPIRKAEPSSVDLINPVNRQ